LARLLQVSTMAITLRSFLVPLANHFKSHGWQVDALAHGAESSAGLECFRNRREIGWSRKPWNPFSLSRAMSRVREVARDGDYHLVHVHTPIAAFITRLALARLRRTGKPKIIYTAHGFHFYRGGHPLKNAVFLTLEKLAGRWTDYLVVINREDEEAAKRHRIVPPGRLRYMPGIGVDTEHYAPGSVDENEVAEIRTGLGLPPAAPLFLMIAEFNPGKRHRDALRAFACLPDKRPHIALAGDGPLLACMRDLAGELGIAQRVHFLGHRSDIAALIRASVATILPSEREGLPRSVMESMSLGVPVIGSDIRGMRDLLGQGGGLLCPVGNVEELSQAMLWILQHPQEALAMGAEGREIVKEYDIRQILKLHEELYDQALAEVSLV
jgi:glycosyltransferase involved in cell wall biosynthesis